MLPWLCQKFPKRKLGTLDSVQICSAGSQILIGMKSQFQTHVVLFAIFNNSRDMACLQSLKKLQRNISLCHHSLYLRRHLTRKVLCKAHGGYFLTHLATGNVYWKNKNHIMCPLGDSSWHRQPILPKFGGFFGLCCTSPLKGHMIWFCILLFCIPQ